MQPQVQELKEKGNESLKNNRYAEAIVYYTHALKLDPGQYQLYSNRSLAFLKMDQYYFALKDAEETIRLKPDWAKAYYRKAEVQFQCQHFEDAYNSYKEALLLMPDDAKIYESMKKSKRELNHLKKADVQYPWIGTGLGFILGVVIVLLDAALLEPPVLKHPFLKMLVIAISCGVFYGIAKLHRLYLAKFKESLLQPPVDLFGDGEVEHPLAQSSEKVQNGEAAAKPTQPKRKQAKKKR